ncbi:unnamed protein product [Auanema sp. JU1783]|nr:unnamed protein product [Auanema sp. JU1783]
MSSTTSDDSYRIWLFVSRIQYWMCLIFIIISLIVLTKAFLLLLNLRRSNYFQFLISIMASYFITLIIILVDIISQSLFISMNGPVLCKILVFLSNVAACFANWCWLVMYLQRCVYLLFPLKRCQKGYMSFIQSSPKLLITCLLLATITQTWSLVLVTERQFRTDEGYIGTTCERDTEKLNPEGYKWVALLEAVSTYACPFICTLFLDLGVLIWRSRSSTFSVISADSVCKKEQSRLLEARESMKIQSSQSILSCTQRRQRAIRRCLVMATVQVLLNAPYYTLQYLDEVYSLQSSKDTLVFYVCSDAFLYFLYLCQYPLLTVYVSSLSSDMKRANTPSVPASPNIRVSVKYKNIEATL